MWEEVFERGGNFGLPIALLVLVGLGTGLRGPNAAARTFRRWFEYARPRALNQDLARKLSWVLRAMVALLGHGTFGLSHLHDQEWTGYLGVLGIGPDTILSAHLIALVGWFEIALALVILIKPFRVPVPPSAPTGLRLAGVRGPSAGSAGREPEPHSRGGADRPVLRGGRGHQPAGGHHRRCVLEDVLKAATANVASKLTVPRTTRAVTLLNIAVADVGVSTWDAKFTYWNPRPENAIHDLGLDPNWKPMLPTSRFPAYPSGSAGYAGAAQAVLTYLFPTGPRSSTNAPPTRPSHGCMPVFTGAATPSAWTWDARSVGWWSSGPNTTGHEGWLAPSLTECRPSGP